MPEGSAFARLLGDRGHATDEPRDRSEERGAEAAIRSERNRQGPIRHDRHAHEGRHEVEDLSRRIEDFGRIVPRERETSRGDAGFVSLAFALVNLQRCP